MKIGPIKIDWFFPTEIDAFLLLFYFISVIHKIKNRSFSTTLLTLWFSDCSSSIFFHPFCDALIKENKIIQSRYLLESKT